MFSKCIRNEIERKFGKEIRYPLDCEALEFDIRETCKERVSASTLKRLFGFIKGTEEPRLYTLDVIAKYLGHKNWDEYLSILAKTDVSEFITIEQIEPSSLISGDTFEFGYEPDRIVTIRFIESKKFNVVASEQSKLMVGDIVTVHQMAIHYPLFVSSVIRDGREQGSYIAGKVSGITYIKKMG